ncbi:mucin-13 [Pithys albifrons albifrons]|uniref:mucin-13 n=1 Tax=Pithys albifrons albifrons TaxID=3385563 RepID=UPI003A5CDEFC
MTTSKPPENFCIPDPCGQNFAQCVSLNSNYTCQCKYGYYFSNDNCYKGKAFPGFITVRGNYSDNVEIVNSTEYEDVFIKVSQFFQKALEGLYGYKDTVIKEIQSLKESRSVSQIRVTVTNLFLENSNATNVTVSSAVEMAINKSENTYISSYKVAKPCDVFPCDPQTTECVGDMVPECKCKSGLEKTEWNDYSCLVCSKDCSPEANKYCAIERGVPTCDCMNNFEDKDGQCVPCPVGFSGKKCEDRTELILIIVGSVFGATILALVIAVSVVSTRVKHKQNPEKKNLLKSGYSDTDISDDRPSMLFPRVQTTSGHANPGYQPNNPYDMRSTNRGHFSGRDYDDLYEASREPRGFRMQNRY